MIIISKAGKNAKRLDQSSFDQEDYLQKYIYDNPDAVPLYEIQEDIRLLILAREFPTASGTIDALGIDQYGNIYLIETKLYRNPDKRTVVGQVLDYGASLWKSSIDFNEFTTSLDKHTNKQFGKGLNEAISGFFGLPSDEVNPILENMRSNLNSGVFKFVVLMDKLHSQLKDLILFINQNSQFDVFAVEIEYYKHEDFEIMIPKIHGTEVKKDIGVKSSGSNRKKWDEQSFWQDAQNRVSPKQLAALKKLYEFAKSTADEIDWGTGATRGSFNPKYLNVSPRCFASVFSDGKISINFGYLDTDESRKKLQGILAKETDVGVIRNIKEEDLAHAYPGISAEDVVKNIDFLIPAFKKFIVK
ncbi:MAG: hypothetical protein A2Y57_02265 [Candidatus Woykebacteria bacterium RBG_13_40_7b]|uniref:DUF91 domain-containing protein n=1 Tax=Candidatus Woykebacteria bacterium RBG_13_40_7b TaxID=1802594 RepID=A0A1G1W8N7_9BACT|nr:MAG: hypothetical protein A2Y57_02265 [Candidatus Woykebacteria bacterium RBG_13_40_7b]